MRQKRIESRHYAAAGRLAQLIGTDAEMVRYLLKAGTQNFYKTWPAPKKHGGHRTISAPQEPLLELQRVILHKLLYRLPVSSIAHGGVPGRSVISHILPHCSSRSLFSVDIESAFDSMYAAWSYDATEQERTDRELGTDMAVLEVIAQLTLLSNGSGLPQGAPTSNVLFNFGCRYMDDRLLRLATSVGGSVTRYVDNIEFSLPQKSIDPPLRRAILRIIKENGFLLNHRKTRYVANGNRPGVPLHITGINIIDGEARLTPQAIRHLRIALWNAGKSGDLATYQGIRGHVFQVSGEWPPQLEGVFDKAKLSLDPVSES